MEFEKLIEEKLQKTGERERLHQLLRSRLVEIGFKDKVKELIQQQPHSTVDGLVQELLPICKRMVPDSIRNELIAKIRRVLQEGE
jgi:enhancer of yellow 2 transcription factor